MNIGETTQALALAQAFDNRTVGEMNIRGWHAILGDLDAADVMEAIRRHYAEHTEWMMPAHVRRLVEQIGQERAKAGRRWAAGQAGVAPEHAMPEIESGGLANGMPSEVREWVNRLVAEKGLDGSREKLFPRQTYWEREHRAYLRSHSGEPNPLYKPNPHRAPLADDSGAFSGTPCGIPTPHPGHPWRIGPNEGEAEADEFWCPGTMPSPPSHYDTQATAGPSGEPYVPLTGVCGVCGAQSQDLGAHRRDYPNGSCA